MSNAAPIVDIYPLSPMQQGMLYHALAEPQSGVDIEQLVITFHEAIDPMRLRAAWERVIARHPVLRSSFRVGNEGPEQAVHAGVQLDFEVEEAAEPDWFRGRFEAWLQEDRTRGFDTERAPLLRFRLFRHGPEHFRLVWTFHHALLDGRSFPILLEEAFGFYQAPEMAEPSQPPPFKGFIEWLQTRDLIAAEAFWRERLAGFVTPSRLPVLGLPGCAPKREQGDAELLCSEELTRDLRALAEREEVTLNTVVQAAWAILLSRYSGEEDVCFGATRAGRHSTIEGAGEIAGLFINTIPVRARVSDEMPSRELLRSLRAFWVEARPFEHTPLARVQAWSEAPGGEALFDTLVVFENYDLQTRFRSKEGWSRRELRLHEQTSFPLCLAAYAGEQLRLVAEFDRSRLDAQTIDRLLGHLLGVLAGLAYGRTVGEIGMVPEPERHQLLEMWEEVPSAGTTMTLQALFTEQAARRPDSIALVQDDVRVTYAELNSRAEIVASHLRAAGAGRETIVGLCLERSPELVIGLLGILKAGAAYLPIDLTYPAERVAFMLQDAAAPVLLTQRSLAASLPAPEGTKLLAIEDLRDAVSAPPAEESGGDDLSYVIYTSGSTGKPKGCCITHRNVVRLFTATEAWFRFTEADVWTLFHSTAFDFSVWEIWGALLYGGTLVVVPFETSRSPEQFRQLLARERVTILNQTPSAFRQLIAADAEEKNALSLRWVIFGGEALEMRSLQPWFERHGDTAPQLVNMYGITETTVHVTYRPLRASDTAGGSVIGRPIPDLRLYILDAKSRPVPIGVPGELHVGGAGLARGYLRRPELTAERFIEDPFRPGERLYKTGDLARFLPGGDIEYLGRIDQQVKIRGFRIELGEIESVLLRHPAIREAAVLPRPDGAGGQRLVAWLVCPGEAPSPVELRRHLKEFLPEYMVPAAFVPIAQMPLTSNGKLDSRALPQPAEERPDLGAAFVAPQTDAERKLAAVWSRVLKVGQVGIDDNFFELGGDSILSILVVTQARQAGITVSPKQLFAHPTIRGLAGSIAPKPTAPMPDSEASGYVPLTPIQRWFFEHDFADPHHWNQSFVFTLKAGTSRAAVLRALAMVLEAHPVFRLQFVFEDGQWRQQFGPLLPIERFIALSPHDLQASLRLEGPLARFFITGDRLTAVIHHLIVDGVSWRIFAEDFDAALAGRSPAASTTGFHTWARALEPAHKADTLQAELGYWRHLLEQPSAPLPVDRPRAANLEATSETLTHAFSPEETKQLLNAVSTGGSRLHHALLFAVGKALTGWAGAPAITIDVEGHGREEALLAEITGSPEAADLSRAIGWFTTIYPARLEHAATLADARAALAQLPGNGFGYSLLRGAGLAPVSEAQVLFNFLGHFDQTTEGLEHARLAQFSTAGWHAPRATRTHLLEINALILDGCLQARWTYSRALHDQSSIQSVANAFVAELRALASKQGFELSPIPAAILTERYPSAEDAYPLTPMQRLFFTLEYARPASGNDQWHCRLLGSLDVERFQRAWAEVLRRHPALRSAYLAEPEPCAVVLADAALAWRMEDWSELEPAERATRFAALLEEDQARAFDLTQAPLTRLTLARVSEREHWLVWTHHHLEIDGWSWPIVFREIAALYAGETLAAARPYSAFIKWLREQPPGESFWRQRLLGKKLPTNWPLPRSGSPAATVRRVLPGRVIAWAKTAQVTVNAVCQAAWTLMLARETGDLDVIFGAAFSGRPADLDGAGEMVGHFVNNLPIRIRADIAESFRSFCARVHQQLAEAADHQSDSLADIQSWSELPWNSRLFSTLLVFQNYVSSENGWRFGEVEVADLHAPVRANYPLTLVFNPGSGLSVEFIAQEGFFTAEQLGEAADHFARLMEDACADPETRVEKLLGPLRSQEVSRPSSATPGETRAFASETERVIAEVWQEALGRPAGLTDNFFDLGGHSLLMLQVHRRLSAKLLRDLPIVTLFRFPTIQSLARHLSGSATSSSTPVSAAQARAEKARAAMARAAAVKPRGR